MQETNNFLHDEFEALILATVILLLVLCLGSSFFKISGKRGFHSEAAAGGSYQPMLEGDPFDFLKQNQEHELERNPFQFQIRIAPVKTPEAAPLEKAVPETAAQPEPSIESDAPAAALEESITPAPQAPQYRLARKRLTYMYSQADNTGKTTAVIKVSGSDAEDQLHTAGTGEQVLGMTILMVGAEQLKILDAAGKQVNISFGETRSATLREQIK
jgi:hypothetical protein